jgi:hypothetical protein
MRNLFVFAGSRWLFRFCWGLQFGGARRHLRNGSFREFVPAALPSRAAEPDDALLNSENYSCKILTDTLMFRGTAVCYQNYNFNV